MGPMTDLGPRSGGRFGALPLALALSGCLLPVHAERLAMTRFEPTATGFVMTARVPEGVAPEGAEVRRAHHRWLLEHLMLASVCLKGYEIESERVETAETGQGRVLEVRYQGRCR
jgi:hypothetical protein